MKTYEKHCAGIEMVKKAPLKVPFFCVAAVWSGRHFQGRGAVENLGGRPRVLLYYSQSCQAVTTPVVSFNTDTDVSLHPHVSRMLNNPIMVVNDDSSSSSGLVFSRQSLFLKIKYQPHCSGSVIEQIIKKERKKKIPLNHQRSRGGGGINPSTKKCIRIHP